MFASISYYTFLLLIIIFYLYLFFENLKRSPKKIKIYIGSFLAIGILKNIFIFFMSILIFQINILVTKLIVFIDLLYIPGIVVLLIYIFLRSDGVKFQTIKTKIGIISIIYIVIILFFDPVYKLNIEYGYTIEMNKNVLFRAIYIIIFIGFLINSILTKLNKSTNIDGLNLMAITMCIFIFENLAMLVISKYMPYCLVGELFLGVTLIYGLKTFKS